MSLKFNRNKLEAGLTLTGYNPDSREAELIRLGVHSFTNHNGMVVKKDNAWGIAEAKPPVSCVTSLGDYENLMADGYLVRLYRITTITKEQAEACAQYYVDSLLDLPYPKKSMMILTALPVYNAILDSCNIHKSWVKPTWCSQLVKRAYCAIDENCLDGYNHKKKEQFTPKTFENRIMFGVFQDVTNEMIIKG